MKLGNNDPGDTGYKLVANNSIYNSTNGKSGWLDGIFITGLVFNLDVVNNYVYCDNEPIDAEWGFLGYPHWFRANRYRTRTTPTYFSVTPSDPQYEPQGNRYGTTFRLWQEGRPDVVGPPFPGSIAGVVPSSTVTTTTAGGTKGTTTATWIHDSDGSASVGQCELQDPLNGDWRPTAALQGVGTHLDNITRDVGPYWAAYDESNFGAPTVGAVLSTEARPKPPLRLRFQ